MKIKFCLIILSLYLSIITLAHTAISAPALLNNTSAKNNNVSMLFNEAELATKKFEDKLSTQISSIRQEASLELAKLRQDIAKKAKILHEKAEQRAYETKLEAEKEVQKLFETAEQKAEIVNDKFENKIYTIKKEAIGNILRLTDKAEQEAFNTRRKARKKRLLQRLEGKPQSHSILMPYTQEKYLYKRPAKTAVTAKWKQKVSTEFGKHTALMEQIIREGETSPQQVSDFIARFSQQGAWFDLTLRSTQYESDPYYNQIIKKKSIISEIINLQKRADKHMQQVVIRMKLTNNEKKRARLLILYDINIAVQKRAGSGIITGNGNTLNEHEIRTIVLNSVQDVTERVSKFYPEFKSLRTKVYPLSSDREKVIVLEKEISQLKNATKSRVEKMGSENLDLELKLNTSQKNLDQLKQQLVQKEQALDETKRIAREEELGRKSLVQRIEQQEKEHLGKQVDLTSKLTQAKHHIGELKEQAKEKDLFKKRAHFAEREVKTLKKDKIESEERSLITDEMSKKIIQEHTLQGRQKLEEREKDFDMLLQDFKKKKDDASHQISSAVEQTKRDALREKRKFSHDMKRLLTKNQQEVGEIVKMQDDQKRELERMNKNTLELELEKKLLK